MEQCRVCLRIPVSTFMIDKTAEVRSELGPEGSIGVDMHGLSLLVEQVILASFDIEPEWVRQYEYLWGCWEKMRLR